MEGQVKQSQKRGAAGNLAGGVAQDLNNTLVPIMALSKLALDDLPEGSAGSADLRHIVRASERDRDLVKQIFAFSRKQDLVRQEVDLAAVTREALRMLRPSLPSTIQIVEQISEVPTLFGDAGELHQVIVNLVTNAAQAIGDRVGKITVTIWGRPGAQLTRDARQAVCVSIVATRCGMDPATFDH